MTDCTPILSLTWELTLRINNFGCATEIQTHFQIFYGIHADNNKEQFHTNLFSKLNAKIQQSANNFLSTILKIIKNTQ